MSLDIAGCCECCIAEHRQAVRHHTLAETSFRTRSAGQDILRFLTNVVAVNPLNAELNPIRHLLALVGAHHIFHVSRLRVNDDHNIIY